MTNKPIAIIGAGNGGQTTAAWLANQGYKTRIFDVMEDTVSRLNELGGVKIYGNTDYPGFGKIEFATTDMKKALEGSELILLILPENYHDSIARVIAPYLRDGQIIILNPAAGLGAISFRKTLADCGCTADVTLAVTNTLLFAARIQKTGDVLVTGQKNELSIVAFPANRREVVENAIYPVMNQHIFSGNIIDAAMENLNLAFHPGTTMLYTSMIERGETFDFYNDVTPSQVKLIHAIDAERMELCRVYKVAALDADATFSRMYGYKGELYDMLRNADCYKGIKGPKSLKVRYLLEDIPYNLRSLQALARIAKLKTPVIDAVCIFGETLVGDAMDPGYSMETLGLSESMTVGDILAMVNGSSAEQQ